MPLDGALLYDLWLRAHAGNPGACAAWFNLGVLRGRAGDPAAAAGAYRVALRLKPDLAEAAINLGTALEAMGDAEAALTTWRAALPPPALRQVLHNQLGRVMEGQGRLGPTAEDLRASLLIAEPPERHDRTRFEVYGYCASPEDGSENRARVITAFDHFVPVTPLTDAQAAARIRAEKIDILIDLNGLTKGARLEILRWKPAPVQATYLGYIGPVPLRELDFILCDAVTIPPEHAAALAPEPLRIDGCYQANDSTASRAVAVARNAEGLPKDALVFCCMSHACKITVKMFRTWMQIVQEVSNSVLWLIDDNPEARSATTARWQAAGLAANRLIFAPRVDPDRYRARLALADLFLDTNPYNAGTIASDALRMGLPLITLQGRAFSSRMASSLLLAVGLPQGVTTSMAEYKHRACQIATIPALHSEMKAQLAGGAWARTPGDAPGFARRFEAALLCVVRRPGASPA